MKQLRSYVITFFLSLFGSIGLLAGSSFAATADTVCTVTGQPSVYQNTEAWQVSSVVKNTSDDVQNKITVVDVNHKGGLYHVSDDGYSLISSSDYAFTVTIPSTSYNQTVNPHFQYSHVTTGSYDVRYVMRNDTSSWASACDVTTSVINAPPPITHPSSFITPSGQTGSNAIASVATGISTPIKDNLPLVLGVLAFAIGIAFIVKKLKSASGKI